MTLVLLIDPLRIHGFQVWIHLEPTSSLLSSPFSFPQTVPFSCFVVVILSLYHLCPDCSPTPAYLHLSKLFSLLLLQENKYHQERALPHFNSFPPALECFLSASLVPQWAQMLSPLWSLSVLIKTELVIASPILWEPFFPTRGTKLTNMSYFPLCPQQPIQKVVCPRHAIITLPRSETCISS